MRASGALWAVAVLAAAAACSPWRLWFAWVAVSLAQSVDFTSGSAQPVADALIEYLHSSWERGASAGRPPLRIAEVASLEAAAALRREIDFRKPFVIRGGLHSTNAGSVWSAERLREAPLGDMVIDYFSDARQPNPVPDARGRMRDIIANITAGGAQKITTESVFRSFPALLGASDAVPQLEAIFGRWFRPSYLGSLLAVPIFMGRGQARQDGRTIATVRTDFHAEPIANVVCQISGSKRWQLALPSESAKLRPRISPDGRAYVMSAHAPDAEGLGRVQVYDFVLSAGDVLWLPTFTWHRVDYRDGDVAFGVSLFHFRPLDFLTRNPAFAVALIPNLIKEVLGMKSQ